MEFLPYIYKWIEVLLRWSHVMFAILWIGNSFLFNYLDNKLEKNTTSKEIDAEGMLATCIQHEIDHLEGILFIDYLSKLKKTMIIKKLSKQKKVLERIVV